MSKVDRLKLFGGYGVEMEYMIVHQDTLRVMPLSDEILKVEAGELTSDVERGEMAWSNELVMHVLELKTNGPAASLAGLDQLFHREVLRINEILEPLQAMLLPTGTHPFMDPFLETKLWPHDSSEIYEAYNQVFDCRGHGWSNLQSTHLNLPFANDEEFGRLHAAIRLILPLIPALSAASPVMDGQLTGLLDARLEVYRKNQLKIPLIAGQVVPEAVFTHADYQTQIFEPMFQAIAPYDPDGVLQQEFLNSRGAIARFGRGAIEIRIIDNQECPLADMTIVAVVCEVLKKLVAEQWGSYDSQKIVGTDLLAAVFIQSVEMGPETAVHHPQYLKALGLPEASLPMKQVWEHLWEKVKDEPVFTPDMKEAMDKILAKGPLAQRMLQGLGPAPSLDQIKLVYHQLSRCLVQNKLYDAESE